MVKNPVAVKQKINLHRTTHPYPPFRVRLMFLSATIFALIKDT
jgi:hypothetical protein